MSEQSLDDRRILLTGACGTIGAVIRDKLSCDFINIDIDEDVMELRDGHQIDLADEEPEILINLARHCTDVIHLAWDLTEDFYTGEICPENKKMAEMVLRASQVIEPNSIILASSAHAASEPFYRGPFFDSEPWAAVVDDGAEPPEKISPEAHRPNSFYAASKIYIESLGRYYAQEEELENITSIRFGGINLSDEADPDIRGYPLVWLSHDDCARLIRAALQADPDYHQLYGVSDNDRCPFDLSNDIGYEPQDNAADHASY